MSSVITSISLSGWPMQPPQAAVEPGLSARSQTMAAASAMRQPGEAPPVRSADGPAAARLEAPAWPEPRTINLPAELLDLTETGITYTSSIEVPETGADFWDMLATALPGDEAG